MPASLAIGIFEHEGLLAPLAKEKFHRSFSLFFSSVIWLSSNLQEPSMLRLASFNIA
jgi:hypothetical protein